MSGFITCPQCESPVAYGAGDVGEKIVCDGCGVAINLQAPPEANSTELPRIITAPEFIKYGLEVVETLDVVTARRVYGSNLWKDIKVAFRDVVGGRSKTAENLLEGAESELLTDLRRKALAVGAHALTDLRLQFGDMGGGSSTMFFATAQATPVVLAESDDGYDDVVAIG